ncbi:MAG TPA: M48 family metalloprotease [Spirochaetia bacterium]|nr:M48 family metalloprotease [Spirochaetia bacterium]
MAIQTRRLTMAATLLAISVMLSLLLASCQSLGSLSQIGTAFGVATGQISEGQAQSINTSAQAVQKSAEDITPEQEYYIGRAVAAVILSDYKVYDDPKATAYINLLGQSLAMASDLPVTFSGYHFLILDSNDINALSAPSGFIFVTRGLLRTAKTEDGVAAILAHEIGHVEHHDGLQAIKKSRLTTALTSVALTTVQLAGSPELAKLTSVFGDSINDITHTLIDSGYSRAFEAAADTAAVDIMKREGFNPWALVDVLKVMETKLKPDGAGFARTHPAPADRIKVVEKEIGSTPRTSVDPKREKRFEAALGNI